MRRMAKTLRLTSPNMHGARQAQHDINHYLHKWGAPDAALLEEDGVYGRQSRKRAHEVVYGQGLKVTDFNAHGLTPHLQSMLHHPGRLGATARKRNHEREAWRKRYVKRLQEAAHGPKSAVAFAEAMARKGIVEHPAGSNRGAYIDNWNRAVGTPPGPYAYWCGAFCNACLVAGGLPSLHLMAYCPSIEAHARSGADGWKWYGPGSKPKAGWLALFTESGVAGHVEFVVADGSPLRTVGGNTSQGNGSPNNGGGVYAHNFSSYRGLPLRGFAAPNYS